MLHQLDALRVSLSTCTDKRPLPGVRAQVGGQVALRREVLIAHVTWVAPAVGQRRPVVDEAEVKPQLSGRVEALRTQAAGVRLCGDVDGEVIVEVGATDKRMSTQLAHVRLLCTV